MERSATYTIQGFIYQFNKTLETVLSSSDDAQVRVEGIIEDIDLIKNGTTEGIQCKYHESSEKFVLSSIYKPVLQMMNSFAKKQDAALSYRLYAYYPDLNGLPKFELTNAHIDEIINTENVDLQKYTNVLKGGFDKRAFLQKFLFQPGESLDSLESKVKTLLAENGLHQDEVDTLFYPNALNIIANKSIQHDPSQRLITKSELVKMLSVIRKIAITRWTLGLKTLKQILQEKRKQLRNNFNINSRGRGFLISQAFVNDFDNEVVNFIRDYISNYHFKSVHDITPLFCLDCTQAAFDELCVRLHNISIKIEQGKIGTSFQPSHFLRHPLVKHQKQQIIREFDIRIMRFDDHPDIFSTALLDDVFICGPSEKYQIHANDRNIEHLEVESFPQLKFIIGVTDAWN